MNLTTLGLILGNIVAVFTAVFTFYTSRKKIAADTRKENTGSDVLILQQNADYVKRLEDRLDVLSDKIDAIEKINDSLKSEKENLARINAQQAERISVLEEKVTHLENELDRYHQIEENIKNVDLQGKVETVVAEITQEVIKT